MYATTSSPNTAPAPPEKGVTDIKSSITPQPMEFDQTVRVKRRGYYNNSLSSYKIYISFLPSFLIIAIIPSFPSPGPSSDVLPTSAHKVTRYTSDLHCRVRCKQHSDRPTDSTDPFVFIRGSSPSTHHFLPRSNSPPNAIIEHTYTDAERKT